MMTSSFRLTTCTRWVAASAALFAVAATAAGAAGVWKLFTSTEGGFKVKLPGTLKVQSSPVATEVGNVMMHIGMIPMGKELYGVAWGDYPAGIMKVDPQSVLVGTLKGVARGMHGSVVSGTRISLQGYPGRAGVISVPSSGTVRVRAYLVKRRLYQVMTATSAARANSADVTGMLNSFHLLGLNS